MAVPTIADSSNAGAFREGDMLTASTTVTTDDGIGINGNSAISYQWQRSANGVSGWSDVGSNSASYTLSENDKNSYLQVITSFTDDTGQTVTQTSAATAEVVDVPPTMAVPTIADSSNAGAFREGDMLTASTTVTTDDGIGINGNSAISYQWQRSANGVSGWSNVGSNSASYMLTENDENSYLQVITSFTDDTGQTVTQTSAATAAVIDAPPTLTVPGALSTNENTPLTITGIAMTEADADDALSMSLSVAHGTLALGSTNGLTVTSNGSNGTLAFSGSQSAISAALVSGVIYTPTSEYEASDILTVTGTNTENGTGVSKNITVNITGKAEPPTLTVQNATVKENSTVALSITDALSEVDADSSLGNVIITGIPSGVTFDSNGTLAPPVSDNVVTEFSINNGNPNGVWTYLSNGTRLNTPVAVTGGNSGLISWSNDGTTVPNIAAVEKNITGGTIVSGTVHIPTDHLDLDPQGLPNVAVRFTAPTAGMYLISGDFLGIDSQELSHSVQILDDGTAVFNGKIDTFNESVPFGLIETLNAGDTIDFVSKTGASYNNLGTGLAATVTKYGALVPAFSDNVVTEFSINNGNPNGAWTYLSNGTSLNTQVTATGGNPGLISWSNGGTTVPNIVFVEKNITGSTIVSGTAHIPTDHLDLDPQGLPNVTVRFTASTSGMYLISGDFLGLDSQELSHAVQILDNGTVIFNGTIASFNQSLSFNLTETLNAGDTIDFVSKTGASYNDLGTGLAATVTKYGTLTLDPTQLSALTMTVPDNDQGNFPLAVSATTNDGGNIATSNANLAVTVLAEGPVLGGTTSKAVNEGGAVTFGATDSVADGDDTLNNVTITGLPTDLTNVNGGTYTAASSTWTGTAAQFNALSFNAGEQEGTFNLSMSATTTGAETGTTNGSYTLTVNPVAEAPSVSLPGYGGGGLLGYWAFDGTGADLSGNGYNLTLNGSATYASPGLYGQALSLNGVKGSNATANSTNNSSTPFDFGSGTGNFTIQVWANFNGAPGTFLIKRRRSLKNSSAGPARAGRLQLRAATLLVFIGMVSVSTRRCQSRMTCGTSSRSRRAATHSSCSWTATPSPSQATSARRSLHPPIRC